MQASHRCSDLLKRTLVQVLERLIPELAFAGDGLASFRYCDSVLDVVTETARDKYKFVHAGSETSLK